MLSEDHFGNAAALVDTPMLIRFAGTPGGVARVLFHCRSSHVCKSAQSLRKNNSEKL
jgi:hypothetical protein